MTNFLDRYHIPKLNQDQKNSLSRPISPKEKEAVIKSLPTKKIQDKMVSAQNSRRFQRKINTNTPQIRPETERDTPNLFTRLELP